MIRAIEKVKPCTTMQDVRREVNALDDRLRGRRGSRPAAVSARPRQ